MPKPDAANPRQVDAVVRPLQRLSVLYDNSINLLFRLEDTSHYLMFNLKPA
jgi:hypothetical protein